MTDYTNSANSHNAQVEKYYRFHSYIYDATRWCFLFGRDSILKMIPDLPSKPHIMEVGCGTGKNILQLQQQIPDAKILGIDLSKEMLNIAEEKIPVNDNVTLCNARYGSHQQNDSFDLILLSYSLTMMGEQYEIIFDELINDLKPGGYIAVVDFHASPFGWFRRWMEKNHVNFGGTLLPRLKQYFHPKKTEMNPAYLGLWSYFLFIGQSKTTG